jgi:hypothetical protein
MTIVEKIKALMAKAASTTNEHEAEVFLAKAYELMEKHQLESSDLETDDPVAGEGFYEKGNIQAAPDWDFMLGFAVASYYGCKACRCTKGNKWILDLVGRESARVTTKEMHSYLVKTVRRLGREAVGTDAFKLYREDSFGDPVWRGEYMNADQCTRRIGNALRIRLQNLAAKHKQTDAARTSTAAGKNALITMDRVVAVYQQRHPEAAPIKGTFSTNSGARKLAEGIGLNLQTGGGSSAKLLGGK